MELGFIGLGHLGKAIAGRLLSCGHNLIVHNRTVGKAEGLDAAEVNSPKEVAEKADIIFLCLFDSAAVGETLEGESGLLSCDLTGKIVVDLTTNHFRDVVGFHETVRNAGGAYLESPVLGSVVPAQNGALTIVTSGDEAAYTKVKGVLEQMGQNLFFLSEAGQATKMKLVNNLALGSIMATIADSLAMAEKAGIAKEEVLDILSVGGGNSLVLNAKKEKLKNEDYATHFSNALIYKDLHCLQDLAYELKHPLMTASIVKELFGKTFEAGFADEDFCSVYKLLKDTSS